MSKAAEPHKSAPPRKFANLFMFGYGIIAGTSTPLLLSRCATSGAGCGSCGGVCTLAIGILPLVAFFIFREKFTGTLQTVTQKIRRSWIQKAKEK